MKALSIKQPWVWAILHAGKDIENRSWPTNFRGRVVIHAGKNADPDGYKFLADLGIEVPVNLPTGAFLGEVEITNCLPVGTGYANQDQNCWAFGPYCFVLANPLTYNEPILGRGQLGFFESGIESMKEEN